MEGQPLFLLLHNPRQLLAVVSHDMMLTQYSVDIKGETTLIMNVCGAYSNVLSIILYNDLWLLIYEFVYFCTNACTVELVDLWSGSLFCLSFIQAKLSGRQKLTSLDWAYDGVLVSCAGEEVVRYTEIYFVRTHCVMCNVGTVMCNVGLLMITASQLEVLFSHTNLVDCRLWDFGRGENYVLGSGTGSDIITCVNYNSNTGQWG